MSPLTPTFTEKIPTIPIISGGSFGVVPHFAAKAQEALDLVNPGDKDIVAERQMELARQKIELTAYIESLKESQRDYDFSDYGDRLLLSDEEIEDILEEKIFRKDGEMNEHGKSFYEYLEILTEGKSKELKEKMKKKLIQEFRLENRVYETEHIIEMKLIRERMFYNSNKEQFFRDLKATGASSIRCMDLSEHGIFREIDFQGFIEIIQVVGKSGIRYLNLGLNQFSEKLDAQEFIELILVGGVSGIRNLDLYSNGLSERLDAQDFIELVRVAGISGIRRLDLSYNDLSEKLDAQDFIELVRTAGESGIRDLTLNDNLVCEKFNTQNLIELVQVAGTSGIRKLDLCWGELTKKLNTKNFINLIRIAGESGIKSLDIERSKFTKKFTAQQKQEFDTIRTQYNMTLD